MAEKILDRDKLKSVLDEVIQELTVQADSRERVTKILKELKAETDIKPSIVRKVANIVIKANFDEIAAESEETKRVLSIALS